MPCSSPCCPPPSHPSYQPPSWLCSCFKELASIGEKRLSTLLGAISAQEAHPPPESDLTAQVEALARVRGLTALILQRKQEGPRRAHAHGDAPVTGATATRKVSPASSSSAAATALPLQGAQSSAANGVGVGTGEIAEDNAELRSAAAQAQAELEVARREVLR